MRELVDLVWAGMQCGMQFASTPPLSTKGLRRSLTKCSANYNDGQAHDALMFFTDLIDEDGDTLLRDLFVLTTESRIRCVACGKYSATVVQETTSWQAKGSCGDPGLGICGEWSVEDLQEEWTHCSDCPGLLGGYYSERNVGIGDLLFVSVPSRKADAVSTDVTLPPDVQVPNGQSTKTMCMIGTIWFHKSHGGGWGTSLLRLGISFRMGFFRTITTPMFSARSRIYQGEGEFVLPSMD